MTARTDQEINERVAEWDAKNTPGAIRRRIAERLAAMSPEERKYATFRGTCGHMWPPGELRYVQASGTGNWGLNPGSRIEQSGKG